MSIFTIAGLLVFLLCVSLSLFAFLISSKKLYLLIGAFNLVVSIWGLGCFLVGFWSDKYWSLWGWRVAHVGGYFIGVIFYHIISIFCKRKRTPLLVFGYLQAGLFTFLTLFTNLIFNTPKEVYGVIYFSATIWYGCAVLIYLIFVLASFVELCRFYFFDSAGLEWKQTLYMLVSFAFGFIGGTSLLIPPFFDIKYIYLFGNFGICIYALILTMALIKFRLFDIDAIIEGFQEARLIRLGLLMASINHEVKNPLYITKGILDTELDKHPDTPWLF